MLYEIAFDVREEAAALAVFCAQLFREGVAFSTRRHGDNVVVIITGE